MKEEHTCLTCQNWQPKKSPAMARHGYAICTKNPEHQYQSHAASCAAIRPAAADVAAKRVTWAQKLGLIVVEG